MGFSLQEAQWLVKFYRNLPGQAAQLSQGGEEAEYMRAMQMQQGAQAQGEYPTEEYDEYW